MPSGYTSDIYENKDNSSRNYVLRAARGLGFLIHMRDDAHDAPIRKRPDDWPLHSEKKLAELKDDLREVLDATDDELIREQEELIERAKRDAEKSEKRYAELRGRYNKVLEELKAWAPETEGGQRTREFAIEHLKESIDFDTNYDPWRYVPELISAEEYRNDRIAFLNRMIASYTKDVERERENKRTTDEWIDGLLADLETL